MATVSYQICPVAKPRMVRGDVWKKRKCVVKYRRFADLCRLEKVQLPLSGGHVIFVLPMPDSWSKKKKNLFDGKAHSQTPDLDNLIKAIGDAVYADDSGIWDIHVTKLWGSEGRIIVEASQLPVTTHE